MKENLAKRLLFFGRTILVVWLLATAVWLQKLDSYQLHQDVQDLNLLAGLADFPRAQQLRRLRGEPFVNATNWLAETDRGASAARLQVRERFARWLKDEGVTCGQLAVMAGKAGASVDRALPFYFLRIAGEKERPPKRESGPPDLPLLPDLASSAKSKTESSLTTVAEYLDELDRLVTPISLTCAVRVDESAFVAKHLVERPGFDHRTRETPPLPPGSLPHHPTATAPPPHDPPYSPPTGPPHPGEEFPVYTSVRNELPPDERAAVPLLISAELFGNEIHAEYTLQYLQEDPMPIQGLPRQRMTSSFSFPVETKTVGQTTLLYLSDPEAGDYESIRSLYEASDRKSYLRQMYGHLPMSSAVALANDGLTQAYRSASLFGFTFSTRRLPFAVLAFVATALLGTLVTLHTARRRRISLLADLTDEYALDVLLANLPARLVIWIVFPLSAVWAAVPLVPLSDAESRCLNAGVLLVFLLGAGCACATSRARRGPPEAPR
jgi:hypothetical protein